MCVDGFFLCVDVGNDVDNFVVAVIVGFVCLRFGSEKYVLMLCFSARFFFFIIPWWLCGVSVRAQSAINSRSGRRRDLSASARARCDSRRTTNINKPFDLHARTRVRCIAPECVCVCVRRWPPQKYACAVPREWTRISGSYLAVINYEMTPIVVTSSCNESALLILKHCMIQTRTKL